MSHSDELAGYYFIPALRRGLTTVIQNEFDPVSGQFDAVTGPRASFAMQLNVEASPTEIESSDLPQKAVELYGPGDILGFDPRIVVRTEPRPNVGDFEPNYFPFIEFAESDFLWRFTAARPKATHGSLIPWITLVVLVAEDIPGTEKNKEVLKEGVIEDPANNKKIPWVRVHANHLPEPAQAWRWAHVQVTADNSLKDTSIEENLRDRLPDILRNEPERVVSRLLCARRLRAGVKYYAYVVPTFKLGVDIALNGQTDANHTAIEYAWSENDREVQREVQLPYYFKWEFRTGLRGDFEHLVRLLTPRPLSGLGVADVDCHNPGYGLLNKLERPDLDPKHEAYRRLAFESALKSVDTDFTPWGRDAAKTGSNGFRKDLYHILNLSENYITKDESTEEEKPVVVPPIYGRWHVAKSMVGDKKGSLKGWLYELNLDPRHRAVAGVGAETVKKQQEQLMASAWDQLGDIEKVNDILRRAQLGRELSLKVEKRLKLLPLSDYLRATTPLHGHFKAEHSSVTVRKQIHNSRIRRAPLDPALRRMARKRGAIRKRQMYQSTSDRPDMLMRLNDSAIKVVDKTIAAQGMNSIRAITDLVNQSFAPKIVEQPFQVGSTAEIEYNFLYETGPQGTKPTFNVIGGGDWLKLIDNADGTATLRGTPPAPPIAPNQWISKAVKYPIQLQISRSGAKRTFEKRFTIVAVSKRILQQKPQKIRSGPTQKEPASVSGMPSRLVSKVVDIKPGSIVHAGKVKKNRWFALQNITENLVESTIQKFPPGSLNHEFGQAVMNGLEGWLSTEKAVVNERPQVDLDGIGNEIKMRLEPQHTIVKRTAKRYRLRLEKPTERARRNQPGRELDTIMVAPEFPQPMCEALEEISQELLLRGIEQVQQNTVALLETNRRFVEAFMCGMNHEFSSELLWREYPSDQRGTNFRQFWRTTDFIPHDDKIRSARERYWSTMGIDFWSDEDKSQFIELYRDQLGYNGTLSNSEIFDAIVNLKAIEESLMDIPPLAAWRAARLGQNFNVQAEERLVLMIRGDLLRKYPNTLIYMVKGTVRPGRNVPDLPEYTDKTGEIRFPIFGGAAKPDIVFLGFNLTAYDARNYLWYLILEERCSEIRFGLDINKAGSDLAWEDFGLANEYDDYIDGNNPSGSPTQWNESAAAIASMTMQSPVRIAINAKQLLPPEEVYFEIVQDDPDVKFVIKLIKSEVIKHARDILRGFDTKKTSIMGRIVRKKVGYNPQWSYHLDPESIEFFDVAAEVCDANMKYVEDNLDQVGGAFLPDGNWCPWGSKLTRELKDVLK